MTAHDRARWDRLAATIAERTGLAVTVDRRGGTGGAYFITHKLPGGARLVVADKWWRRNLDVWIGWQVHLEGADSIVRREYEITKKRGDVARAIEVELLVAAK